VEKITMTTQEKREIKFRAWVKTGLPFGESGMCKVKDLISIHNGVENTHSIYVEIKKETSPYKDQDYWQIWKSDFELMQFTGLKDKNGKEIYEGDIVRYIEDYIQEDLIKRSVGVVKYSGCSFKIDDMGSLEDWQGIEIIGNIYEHSHLLDNIDTKNN